MYQRQITVNYSERVNPYTCRCDKSFSFLQKNRFKFIKFKDLEEMDFSDVLDYLLDVYDYINFLRYIGKFEKAKVVEKIEDKIIAIAKKKKGELDEAKQSNVI